jgi:hypothetical protein
VTVLNSIPSIPHGEVLPFSPKPVIQAAAIKEIPRHALPEELSNPPARIGHPSKDDLKFVLWIFIVIAVASLLAVFFF